MSETLHTADGLRLHITHFPAPPSPRGHVLLVHGLGEHAGRYAHVAAAFAARGWAVHAHDHRGHGRSEGPRGVLASPRVLLADLGAMVALQRAQRVGPLLLLGHSLGGVVAARYVAEGLAATPARWWRPVDGLMLSSPALDAGLGLVNRLLLSTLGPISPSLQLANGLDVTGISRDKAVVAAYQADPLVHDRVSPRLVRFIVDAGEQVRALAGQWTVPTMLQWAGADRLVAPRGSAAFAAAAPAPVVAHRVWPALFHELMNEPEQAEVLATYLDWADARWPARRA